MRKIDALVFSSYHISHNVFRVGALNNDLKFFGTTTFDEKNIQNVSIDGNGFCKELTVNFTDHELAKNERFCRGHSQCIPSK